MGTSIFRVVASIKDGSLFVFWDTFSDYLVTIVKKEQLSRFYSVGFIGQAYSRMLKNGARVVNDARSLEHLVGEMKCLINESWKSRFFMYGESISWVFSRVL